VRARRAPRRASEPCRTGGERSVVVGRPASGPLALRLPALVLETPLARRAGRPRRAARLGPAEGLGPLAAQPLQRELAAVRLAAGVLGDCRDLWTKLPEQEVSLLLRQRLRGLDVEDCLHSRGRHVRVLAARAGRAARPELDLIERNEQLVADHQSLVHACTV